MDDRVLVPILSVAALALWLVVLRRAIAFGEQPILLILVIATAATAYALQSAYPTLIDVDAARIIATVERVILLGGALVALRRLR